ncbi:MAG: DnaJ domain-containing protein [Myxococcota bacterium]
MADDYYAVLGVARDATDQDIKRAFREIARKNHPDVAGADPAAEDRFKEARKAYETLMDPVARARYDRRGQRRAPPPGGSFFDAFYRATGERDAARSGPRVDLRQGGTPPPPSGTTGRRPSGNDLGLEDLFDDFGDFGFGQRPAGERTGGTRPNGRATSQSSSQSQAPRSSPQPGDDVHVELEVPAEVARSGGSATAVYHRMQRADSWRPGAPDPGLVRVQDIADIRILPGTADGEVLRERGLGSAGSHGGPYGDLLVAIRIAARPTPTPGASGASEGAAGSTGDGSTVDLSIVEAMLGGRVTIATPHGKVKLTIPPGTSSGVRLRLKGKGPVGPDGAATDWFVATRIVVPASLDPESRRLIEEYARLNPSTESD